MVSEITMPKLSDTMTEGQFGVWRKNVGDRIERGDIIAEVETDKATMDLEAFTSGILLEQRVHAGDVVPVGTVIGLIGQPEDAVAGRGPVHSTSPLSSTSPEETAALPVSSSTVGTEAVFSPAQRSRLSREALAAPVVRRRAAELGIDLDMVRGSGPGGRIMLEDLAGVAQSAPSSVLVAGEAARQISEEQVQPFDRLRSAMARTTAISWQSIPHFYLSRDMEMGQAVQVVQRLKADGVDVSLNALIMTAVAGALATVPALNAAYSEQGMVNHQHVNMAFAVALEQGLQMPVVKAAELLGLREMTAEVARLTERARQGRLTQAEISGGTFSVSNLGMYGVDSLGSIIMPGQSAILALGSVAERPVARNGQISAALVLTATLSCDHRVIDGATAAKFLNECKRLLEHPDTLSA